MATGYRPPLDHIRFVLDHLLDVPSAALPGFEHADNETMVELVAEFGRFCAEQLAPLNPVGDRHGCTHDPASGAVTTAPGWRDAYDAYVAAGWPSVAGDAEHGGGGFPWLLGAIFQELLSSANMAFGLAPMLTQGAVELLSGHGSAAQRRELLPHLIAGTWTGTMCLTEPQAGSDVGALTTRATEAGDGSWRLNGTKIFITYGEHDLTGNIVHLVLARRPGAAPGTAGISCFVVPKVLPDGTPNAVRCVGIEHKLGIHASPTCTLSFEDAVGWLVGDEPDRGMAQMFTMMNNARVAVGISGLAVAERAHQAAADHARERVQAGPIAEHPDVQRMLLHSRAHVEAMRMLAYTNAWAIDLARAGRTEDERRHGQEQADLLTPITKSWCTQVGSEVAYAATQVHGGMGYITETGVAQYERDVRIAAIYEGTNGIQAIDLVGRKIGMRGGAVVGELLDRVTADAEAAGSALGAPLADAVDAVREATRWLGAASDRADARAGASPYLRMFGTLLGGWLLVRQALVDDDPDRHAVAAYYCGQVLPGVRGLLPAATAGVAPLRAIATDRL